MARSTGIRTHLLTLCVVALVPVTGLVAWQVQVQRERSEAEITSETVRLSRILAERLSGHITQAQVAVDTSMSMVRWTGEEQVCNEQMALVRDLSQSVSAAFVADATGAIVCSNGVGRSMTIPGRSYLGAASAGPNFMVTHEPSGVFDRDPVLVLSRSLQGTDGLVVAALLEMGPALADFGNDYGLEMDSAVFLVEEGGYVVAADPDGGEGRRLGVPAIVSSLRSGGVEGAAESRDLDGEERMYSFVDVPGSDNHLFAVVATPFASTRALMADQLRTHLVAATLVMIVALGASALVAELSIARPLRAMRDRLARIGAGDLTTRSSHEISIRELAQVDDDIDEMAMRLEQRAASLELANEERHRLLDELLMVQDEERRRVAADIHDDTIQSMIASGLAVQLVRHDVTDPAALERLRVVEDRIASAIARLRQLMFELEPVGTAGDLTAAVEQYLESALDRPLDLEVTCSDLDEPSGTVRQVLFRNLRESVLNASRHGAATRIEVELSSVQGGIEAIVSDNGTGMTSSTARRAGHHGLRVMRERVEALGGSLTVESEPGDGTTVYFWIPNNAGSGRPRRQPAPVAAISAN